MEHNLKFDPSNCGSLQTQVEHLSHMIYPSGLRVQKAKVEAISQVPQSLHVNQLWTFIGLCNHYQRLGKRCNNIIVKPSTQFMKIPILWWPIQGSPFQLHTHWNTLGFGVVFT